MPPANDSTTMDNPAPAKSPAMPTLKHSRSYVTLSDLPDLAAQSEAPASGVDMDTQSNGQQVTATLVHEDHHKESSAATDNPFRKVLPSNGRTEVVSLTAPAAGRFAYSSNTSASSGVDPAKQGRKGGKKRRVAWLSLAVVLIATLLRGRREASLLDLGAGKLEVSRATLGASLSSSSSWLWGSSGPADVPPQVDLESWNSTRFAAPLLTEWGEALSPGDVSSVEHHPRPQLQRPGEWVNLNGFWDFRVEDATHGAGVPSSRGFEGKILVPFAIESALSGVARDVSTEKQLVYRRHLELPESSLGGGKRHILHFGAVDWKAWVYINDELVGTHEGGFDPFHFDVTGHLRGGARNGGGKHELKVVAWDPTEDGPQPHGKQWRDKGSDRLIAPEGMWYTSVTGIWQTVWLEAVPEKFYIESVHLTPSIKSRSVRAKVETVAPGGGMPYVKMTAYDEHGIVGFGSGWSGDEVALKFNENHIPRLWSPDSPFLYNLTVSLHLSGRGEIVDQVESYFAMREVSLGRAGEAVQFHLNGEPLFQYGVLDQGWWPDGLYTPPSEDALAFDILKAKEFGFNLIRKHAKVESDRFYHLCDRLGMLVWQDMPSSTGIYMWSPDGAHDFVEGDKVPEAASGFLAELRGVMHSLYSHPSVVGWIPFNEGWGQFDTVDIFAWMQRYDPQRLVWVSGGNDFGIGAAFDRHVYPGPSFVRLEECRASVLGEFGGNGFAIPEHSWRSSADEGGAGGDNYDTFLDWGYAQVRTLKELEGHYQRQMTVLDGLVKQGLSAAIFTQLTDVESESNGLMTYDRKVMKLDPEVMKSFHGALYRSGSEAKQGLHEFGLHPSEGSKCPWEE